MKKDQKGFSVLVLLLILILLAILGFTGYYVYNTQQNKKNTDNTKSADNNASSQPAAASSVTKPDTTKYLVIKEWGVKIPLTGTIADANYVVSNGYVYVSTDSLVKKYPDCAANKTTVYAFGRFKSMMDAYDQPGGDGKTYGDMMPNAPMAAGYYYYGTPSQASCNLNGATTAVAIAAAEAELKPYKDAFAASISKVVAN